MGFQNRCRVPGAEGPLWLTVPLVGGRNQKTPLEQIRIANQYAWQDQHWKTLCSCYNRSPWFEFYRGSLEPLFHTGFERLTDWNLACFEWVQQQLGLTQGITLIRGYEAPGNDVNTLDWRNRVTPKRLKEEFPVSAYYTQVFEDRLGFLPHQSILDLLFCTGKRAKDYLWENRELR